MGNPGDSSGVLTATWSFWNDSDGPSGAGPRVSYGAFVMDSDMGPTWLEFWLAYRSSDDLSVASIGSSYVFGSYTYQRISWGPFFDLGFERKRKDEGAVFAGLLGGGYQFVVRLHDHWDLSAAVEGLYRTTGDFESQLRVGFTFRHKSLWPWRCCH